MRTQAIVPGKPRILVVDDEPSMLLYTKTLLETADYQVETASTGIEAIQKVKSRPPDLMLLDICMPNMSGLQIIQACRDLVPDQRIVMVTCSTDTGTVVRAMRLGALDYMTKPIYKAELDAVIKRCLSPIIEDEAAVPRLHFTATTEQEHIDHIDQDLFFLAANAKMKQIRAQAAILARVDVPILLLGESGVGKEVLARLIHNLSPRANKPFIKVNCAALPVDLLESELFGYEAGAFTGASRAKPGKFELANQGTLLLDELGEMHPTLQAKLLHVLQDGQYSRLGGRTSLTADVRVLAATNVDIQKAITQKTFREDLYYRLNAFTIEIPPLRERPEEIPLLLKHYLERFTKKYAHSTVRQSDRINDACLRYHWPGNLRELGNFAKRYAVLQDEALAISELQNKCRCCELPDLVRQDGDGNLAGLKSLVRISRDEIELKAIESALQATHWNRKLAARRLNISYKALLNKVKQYRLTPPQ
jgi:two-component system, NtrC family, response regulator AtoC